MKHECLLGHTLNSIFGPSLRFRSKILGKMHTHVARCIHVWRCGLCLLHPFLCPSNMSQLTYSDPSVAQEDTVVQRNTHKPKRKSEQQEGALSLKKKKKKKAALHPWPRNFFYSNHLFASLISALSLDVVLFWFIILVGGGHSFRAFHLNLLSTAVLTPQLGPCQLG